MVNQVRIDGAQAEAKPWIVWNGFVNLLTMTEYDQLTPQQQLAHLVFWYESEVQNGGHLQYFNNQPLERAEATITALRALGALPQSLILESALARWRDVGRLPPADVNEYIAMAVEREFADCDRLFGECARTLIDYLQQHLASHGSDYIVRE
jgi:hypothetical protein